MIYDIKNQLLVFIFKASQSTVVFSTVCSQIHLKKNIFQ